jgi:DNA invertase Pin-like site-specific DNA recombinase
VNPKSPRVLTYSRVSTNHHEQKPENQVNEMRGYCAARGWFIAEEVIDHGFSGGTDNRPGLKRLLFLARGRLIDVVIVTKLDRMARSLKHLVGMLDEFSAVNIQFISIGDQIDLGTASGRLMLHIIGAFGEFERGLIRERTLVGLAHAKARGQTLGRPRMRDDRKVLLLRAQGLSLRRIAATLEVSLGSVQRSINSQKTK